MTYYQFITLQQDAGLWKHCINAYKKSKTFDFYYRIYQIVLEDEPERKYGYRKRICSNLARIKNAGLPTLSEEDVRDAVYWMNLSLLYGK